MEVALTNLTDIVGTCMGIITGNSILMTCFVGCLAGIAFGVIKKAKGAAR